MTIDIIQQHLYKASDVPVIGSKTNVKSLTLINIDVESLSLCLQRRKDLKFNFMSYLVRCGSQDINNKSFKHSESQRR